METSYLASAQAGCLTGDTEIFDCLGLLVHRVGPPQEMAGLAAACIVSEIGCPGQWLEADQY